MQKTRVASRRGDKCRSIHRLPTPAGEVACVADEIELLIGQLPPAVAISLAASDRVPLAWPKISAMVRSGRMIGRDILIFSLRRQPVDRVAPLRALFARTDLANTIEDFNPDPLLG
jgi:hypothetical protein